MMVVENKYSIGEMVYLKTDPQQLPRIVFCIRVYGSDMIYELASGTTTSSHYDYEISKEKNILILTTD